MKKIVPLLAAFTLFLTMGLLAGVPGSASAAVGPNGGVSAQAASDCFTGRMCFWRDADFKGELGMYSPSTSCYNMGVMNDEASSVYNRSGRTVWIYEHANCTGANWNVANENWSCCLLLLGLNDKITSFRWQ